MADTLLDVESLFRQKLDSRYDPAKLDALLGIVQGLRRDKAGLDELVRNGKLSGRQFAERTNALLQDYLSQIANVLGPEDYERVFGHSPDQRVDVVDPEIAARVPYRKAK